MDIQTLHSQIRKGDIQDFYIFTGSEWMLQRKYIEQIAKIEGHKLKYIEAFKDIYTSLSNSFISVPHVYVVRDDVDIQNNESLQAKIKSGVLKNNVLILLLTNVDKRKKFYTGFKDMIVDFQPLKPEILKKYLQKEISLSDKNCHILMEVCEYDYGRCLLEIDKIKRVDGSPDKVFEQLLQHGDIYVPAQDALFKFTDAVLRRQSIMFELLAESYESGEATMVLLSVLYTNAKQVLQVQSCDSKDISKVTGLTAWQVKCAKEKAGKWRNGELVNLMRLCQAAEKGIKTGQLDEEIAVEYVLLNAL